MSIGVASDADSWFNDFIPALLLPWLAAGHRCAWTHRAETLPAGDTCFCLSYGRIVGAQTRARHRHTLVVHESALPHGRGWSPMTWQVLEGASRIPVTLLEAVDAVDGGPILWQTWMALDGTELVDDLRRKQAQATRMLCHAFVAEYPDSADWGAPSMGSRRGTTAGAQATAPWTRTDPWPIRSTCCGWWTTTAILRSAPSGARAIA